MELMVVLNVILLNRMSFAGIPNGFDKALLQDLTYSGNLVYGEFARSNATLTRSNQLIYNGLKYFTQYCRKNLIGNTKKTNPAIIRTDCGTSLLVDKADQSMLSSWIMPIFSSSPPALNSSAGYPSALGAF